MTRPIPLIFDAKTYLDIIKNGDYREKYRGLGGDPDDWWTVEMAERQAAKSARFSERYGHVFIAPKAPPNRTWINLDYSALEMRMLAEYIKPGYRPEFNLHDEIIFTKEDDMNEKIKKALEAARLFIGGLSQYNNKVLPKTAFEEAKGTLGIIAEAQGVVERPPPEKVNEMLDIMKTQGVVLSLSEHGCSEKICDCRLADTSALIGTDRPLWELAKEHVYLRLLTLKYSNRKRFAVLTRAEHQFWGSAHIRGEMRSMASRLRAK